MRYTPQLLPSRSGNLGILALNRPDALNALTLEMMECCQDVLRVWYGDPTVKAILVKSAHPGEGDDDGGNGASEKKKKKRAKAFCAGGDVKSIYENGTTPPSDPRVRHGMGHPSLHTSEFFRQEYKVNCMMSMAPKTKPQVSIWDGVVMGGGAGISVHGKYRIATENTVFAMPEASIGLFPDVGSMYWMPRLLGPGQAVYLALTGTRLKPEDLLYTGLATHYVPSQKIPDLETALIDACKSNPLEQRSQSSQQSSADVVAPVLMSFHENPSIDPLQSAIARHNNTIHQIFGKAMDTNGTVEQIVSDLQRLCSPSHNSKGSDSDGNSTADEADAEFGANALETLGKMSPTSLKVTLEGLKRGARVPSIAEDLRMEFRMSQAFVRRGSVDGGDGPSRAAKSGDLYEGIRAALVDKDYQPRWNPSTLEQVTEEMVESYFQPLEDPQYEWEPLDMDITDTETKKS